MKKHFLSKIVAMTMAILMIFSLCACNAPQSTDNYPKNGVRKIITVDKQMYSNATVVDQLTVAHYENEPEILLIEMKSAVKEFLTDFIGALYPGYSLAVEETKSTLKLTRENGAYCEIDFVKDTIYFSEFDMFTVCGIKTNPHDLLSNTNMNAQGESIFFKRESSFYTSGNAVELNLAERNITLDIYEGKKYIPFQTFNDLFLTPYDLNIAYNGQSLFVLAGGVLLPELEPLYYHEQKTQRTDALVEFTYNELCLLLDVYYGLDKEHGVTKGFADYFERTGLKEGLLSNDALEYSNAFGTLCWGYIADSHTAVNNPTPYLGEKELGEGKNVTPAPEILEMLELQREMTEIRSKYFDANANFLQKVDNTAYITFDAFTLGQRTSAEDMLKTGDVIDFVYYANTQISQDETIENVVIDLSCNGGGTVDSAVYLVSWLLGGCDLSVYNSLTGSKALTSYVADVNLDGLFDENDNISDKNIYCLISPLSFSCGNTVPALLKESGKVTLLGKTTGGGTCCVVHAITADGTMFSISGRQTMSIVKNGTYYNIDKGVEPNITLSKTESFYDRDALTKYINEGLK
jgi:hypothetical protein